MLVFPQKKLLIITPPKNASTTLYKALKPLKPHVVETCFPGTDHLSFLSPAVPDEYHEYKSALVIRNPYIRSVSFWSHFKYHRGCEDTFEKWCEERLVEPSFWVKPTSAYMNSVVKYHIRVERLIPDLRKLGFIAKKLPHEHHLSTHYKHHTPKTVEIVKKWAAEDFELFGYSPECFWMA